MSKFMIIGGIIGIIGGIVAFGFEREWGMWVTIIGASIAFPSIFEPKPEKKEEN